MDEVIATVDGVVHEIALNNPERLNALSHQMVDQMLDALEAADADANCRVVVIRGVGRAFCAGDDLKGMGKWPARRWAGHKMAGLPVPQQLLIKTVREFRVPTIAAIRGYALGMGLDLALSCDIRICTETSQLGDPRVHRALYAATGVNYQLPRVVGYGRALEMMILGEQIGGIEAQQSGLVYRAVAEDNLDDAVGDVVARLSIAATKSIEVIKLQLREQMDLSFDQAHMHSNAVRSTLAVEDTPEGHAAFNEKREPQFTGR